MPTYTYQCRRCGGQFEVRQRITEPPLRECTLNGCHGHVDRVIHSVGVIFKGSGFHVNDYPNSKGLKRSDGAKKDTFASDSKSDHKGDDGKPAAKEAKAGAKA